MEHICYFYHHIIIYTANVQLLTWFWLWKDNPKTFGHRQNVWITIVIAAIAIANSSRYKFIVI